MRLELPFFERAVPIIPNASHQRFGACAADGAAGGRYGGAWLSNVLIKPLDPELHAKD
jgi:hypothetical protein